MVNTGAVLSTTVTAAVEETEFPLASTAVTTTEFTPKFVQSKLVLLKETVGVPQLSVRLLITLVEVI